MPANDQNKVIMGPEDLWDDAPRHAAWSCPRESYRGVEFPLYKTMQVDVTEIVRDRAEGDGKNWHGERISAVGGEMVIEDPDGNAIEGARVVMRYRMEATE